MKQKSRQKVYAVEVAYTSWAVLGSSLFCTTSTDEETEDERKDAEGGAALGAAGLSSRNATDVLTEATVSLGGDVLNINWMSNPSKK